MGNLSNIDAIGFANQFDRHFVEEQNSGETTVVKERLRPIVSANNVDFFYGRQQALKKVSIDIKQGQVTCLIGPRLTE